MIDEKRIQADIDTLAAFTASPEGVTRLSYTKEQRDAQGYLLDRMNQTGLKAWVHPSGNLIGRYEGRDTGAPAVVTGSHYDTVRSGGAYDGICGVVSALEAFRQLKESGFKPPCNLDMVAFIEEEGTRFRTATLGSFLLLGMIGEQELHNIQDAQGISLVSEMEKAGLNWREALKQPWTKEKLRAFVELHIEQGPIMERNGKTIGVVSNINGMITAEVTLRGQANHAGTIPMDARRDPMRGAVNFIEDFYRIVGSVHTQAVATVGRMTVSPASSNVIPGEVSFTLDFRSFSDEHVENIKSRLLKRLEQTRQGGLEAEYKEHLLLPAVYMDQGIRKVIEESTAAHGFAGMPISSGACHDAVNFARLCPTAMIFIPSRNGRSHCPQEYTDITAIAQGAQVLGDTLRHLCTDTGILRNDK